MKVVTLAIAVACATVPATAFAQNPTTRPNAEATLTIAGDATVDREPDLARLHLTRSR